MITVSTILMYIFIFKKWQNTVQFYLSNINTLTLWFVSLYFPPILCMGFCFILLYGCNPLHVSCLVVHLFLFLNHRTFRKWYVSESGQLRFSWISGDVQHRFLHNFFLISSCSLKTSSPIILSFFGGNFTPCFYTGPSSGFFFFFPCAYVPYTSWLLKATGEM